MRKQFTLWFVLFAACAGCGAEEPTASATPGPIVFSARPDAADASGWQLFVMNADGSDLRRLTHTDGDTDPSWSPDGTQIAFDRCCGSEAGAWLIDQNGENERLLADDGGGFGSTPTWSPDGSQLAFTRTVGDESYNVVVIDADGNNERTLLLDASLPVWSPDGERILFERGKLYEERLYVAKADGSDVRALTNGPGDSCAAWSPDGEKIAYCSGRDGEVYVMDADGSNARQVSHVTKSDSGFVTPVPVWSPDGKQLAYTMLGPDEDSEVIAVVEADGTNQRTLSPLSTELEYTTDKNPVWSPDGRQFVFVNSEADPGRELWIMNADGTGRRVFAKGPYSEPDLGLDWAPAAGD